MAVFWGIFGYEYRYIVVTAIMSWGPGDAAAAIVGRNWGRHKLSGKRIEGIKSVEGSVAMGIFSLVCTFLTLYSMSSLDLITVCVLSFVIAPVAALVELYTKRGFDTITVPIATSIILFISMFL